MATEYQFTLVGKFSWGRPAMTILRKEVLTAAFLGEVHVGLLDNRHILFKFDKEEDFQRMWLRKVWHFAGFQARLFRWTKEFSPEAEPSISPVWIRLPLLPIHFFEPEKLYTIASVAGNPLKMDAATAAANHISRPSEARVCVEMDVQKSIPERVWVGTKEKGKWQKLEIEDRPDYCQKCKKLGHKLEMCQPKMRNTTQNLVKSNKEEPTTTKKNQMEWTMVTRRKGAGLFIRDKEGEAADGLNRDQSKEAAKDSKGKGAIPGSIPQICNVEEVGPLGNVVAETSSKPDIPRPIETEPQEANLKTTTQAKPCGEGTEATDKEKAQNPSPTTTNKNNQEENESNSSPNQTQEVKEIRPENIVEKGTREFQMEESTDAANLELTEPVKISALEIRLTSMSKEANMNKANDLMEQNQVDTIFDPIVFTKSPNRSPIQKIPSESNLQGMILESEGEEISHTGTEDQRKGEAMGTKVKLSPKILKIARKNPPPSTSQAQKENLT